MNRLASIVLFCLLTVSNAETAAQISCPYVPRTVKLLEADFVVLGSLSKADRKQDPPTGELTIQRILKGTSPADALKFAWSEDPSRSLPSEQPDPFTVGIQAVWILTRSVEGETLVIEDRESVIDATEIEAVESDLEALNNLSWSEARQGLQLALVVEVTDISNRKVWLDGRLVSAQATVAIFPVARNVGDEELTLCDFAADHPFVAVWSRTGAQNWQPKLYSTTKAASSQPTESNFHQIGPNEIRRIGHGFVLAPLMDDGDYSLSVTFSSQRDSISPEIAEPWKGAVTIPQYRLHLPLER